MRAVAGRRVERRDAGAAGAQPLGERALRAQLDLELAVEEQPLEDLVLADVRRDHLLAPGRWRAGRRAPCRSVPQLLRDDGQLARARARGWRGCSSRGCRTGRSRRPGWSRRRSRSWSAARRRGRSCPWRANRNRCPFNVNARRLIMHVRCAASVLVGLARAARRSPAAASATAPARSPARSFCAAARTTYDYGAAGRARALRHAPDRTSSPIRSTRWRRRSRCTRSTRLSLRVQPSGNRADEADLLYHQRRQRRRCRRAARPSRSAIGPTTNVRASLTLNQTCPDRRGRAGARRHHDLAELRRAPTRPTASSSAISWRRPSASTSSIGARSPSAALGGVPTTPAASGHIDGSFDFVVRQGKAAQAH